MNELKDKFYEDFQDCEDNPQGFLAILKQYPAVELYELLNIQQCKKCD